MQTIMRSNLTCSRMVMWAPPIPMSLSMLNQFSSWDCMRAEIGHSKFTCSRTMTWAPPISVTLSDLAKPSSSAEGAPSFTSAVAPVALHPCHTLRWHLGGRQCNISMGPHASSASKDWPDFTGENPDACQLECTHNKQPQVSAFFLSLQITGSCLASSACRHLDKLQWSVTVYMAIPASYQVRH